MHKNTSKKAETPSAGSGPLMQRRSIIAQLFFYCALCLPLLIGVSGFALYHIVQLHVITTDLGRYQLPQTRILGELCDILAELRIDQFNLALAGDERSIE